MRRNASFPSMPEENRDSRIKMSGRSRVYWRRTSVPETNTGETGTAQIREQLPHTLPHYSVIVGDKNFHLERIALDRREIFPRFTGSGTTAF
jgi:hypothetical protein